LKYIVGVLGVQFSLTLPVPAPTVSAHSDGAPFISRTINQLYVQPYEQAD